MPTGASGWNWLGLNLDDGSALMAFQLRAIDAQAPPVWSSAKLRLSDGDILQPSRDQIRFVPQRHWTSPRGGRYPVQARITLGERTLHLRPLFDAQELASHSMGNTYWEGAVTAFDSDAQSARPVGRGYWELTGYAGRLRL